MKKIVVLLSLFLTLLIPYLCGGQNNEKTFINVNQLIDSINLSLYNNYVFLDKAQLISKYLRSQVKSEAYGSISNDPHKLAIQIQADIYKTHRDPHMVVEYNPGWSGHSQVYTGPSEEEMIQFKK